MRNLPVASRVGVLLEKEMEADGPIAVIFWPSMRTVESWRGGAPVASITVAWIMASVGVCGAEQPTSVRAKRIRTEEVASDECRVASNGGPLEARAKRVARVGPPPCFFVSVAFKGVRFDVSSLESTLVGWPGGVDPKGVRLVGGRRSKRACNRRRVCWMKATRNITVKVN
jgi:hypothetical protein